MAWDPQRWPNFSQAELQCSCGCKTFVQDDGALDALQALRNELGVPISPTSASRCRDHNKAEGGAESSEHLNGRAFDIPVAGIGRVRLLAAARKVGFRGFGFANSFLHVDTGRPRHWFYGAESKKAWAGIAP